MRPAVQVFFCKFISICSSSSFFLHHRQQNQHSAAAVTSALVHCGMLRLKSTSEHHDSNSITDLTESLRQATHPCRQKWLVRAYTGSMLQSRHVVLLRMQALVAGWLQAALAVAFSSHQSLPHSWGSARWELNGAGHHASYKSVCARWD